MTTMIMEEGTPVSHPALGRMGKWSSKWFHATDDQLKSFEDHVAVVCIGAVVCSSPSRPSRQVVGRPRPAGTVLHAGNRPIALIKATCSCLAVENARAPA